MAHFALDLFLHFDDRESELSSIAIQIVGAIATLTLNQWQQFSSKFSFIVLGLGLICTRDYLMGKISFCQNLTSLSGGSFQLIPVLEVLFFPKI